MKSLVGLLLICVCACSNAASALQFPRLNSAHAAVFDVSSQAVLFEKDADTAVPIASVTKLLTAMVALDAHPDLSETISVTDNDVDMVKHSSSHVPVGTRLSRDDMLHLALMSSENRAASALSRNYEGGQGAFVQAMNAKARLLGMTSTSMEDPTGLSPHNRSSASDLVRMVLAADKYKPITRFTTTASYSLPIGHRVRAYHNTNRLVGKSDWDIELSKTGFIEEAGRCIVMKLATGGKRLVVVLLGSQTSAARLADIEAIKKWVGRTSMRMETALRRAPVNKNIDAHVQPLPLMTRIDG